MQDRGADQPYEQAQPVGQAAVSPAAIACPTCGYNLTGVVIGGACPECGETISSIKQGGKSSGKAIASLVLGICSIATCMFYGVPAIVCGILAIVFARQVQRLPDHHQLSDSAKGMNNAGRITGIIGLCLGVATLLFMVAYFVLIFAVIVPQAQRSMPVPHMPPTTQTPTAPAPYQPSAPPASPANP